MIQHQCKTCGGTLILIEEGWQCPYCKNVYKEEKVKSDTEELKKLLDDMKIEQVSNLRRNLYDAVNAEYIDSEEICRICGNIKALLPDDFAANFYYTANHGTPKQICEAIKAVDISENKEQAETVVRHMAKSIRSEYVLPLKNIVELAFKQDNLPLYEELTDLIDDEISKVNASIYDTSLPRDLFIAYSSKDMDKVIELVDALEENGVDCFVALRNLRHGRGSVQNYEKLLHEAMDNCRVFLFVSSQNSRTSECDAYRVEMKYIKSKDIENSPHEYRQSYLNIPEKYKKKRIEYRIDNLPSKQGFTEKAFKEFFSGLEHVYSPEAVFDRLSSFDFDYIDNEEEKKDVKFCAECGYENPSENKFCKECGKSIFVPSLADYISLLQSKLKEKSTEAEKEEATRKEEENKHAAEKAKKEAEIKAAEKLKAEKEKLAKKSEEEKRSALEASKKAEVKPKQQEADLSHFTFTPIKDGSYSVKLKDIKSCPSGVVIPKEYNGKKVSEIGEKAFYECKSLKKITLPEGLNKIGCSAFGKCTLLESINIPKSVNYIAFHVFWGCSSLKSIALPENVDCVQSDLFTECSSLVEVNLSSKIKFIAMGAFSGCTSLERIRFGGSKAEWEKLSKGFYWNDNCPTFKVICKDGEISELNPKEKATDEFYKLYELKYKNSRECVVGLNQKAKDEESYPSNIVIPISDGGYSARITCINQRAFSGCKSLVSVTLPQGITTVEQEAFSSCTSLEKVNLPDSISYIGKFAFGICSSLKSIRLPAELYSIASETFSNCTSLASIDIPGDLDSIGSMAFYACSSLANINYKGTKNDWKAIKKGFFWKSKCPKITVNCTDGSIII